MVLESVITAITHENMASEERVPMRFGLCCLFKDEEIAFRTTTAKVLSALPRNEQLKKLSGICYDNAQSSCNLCKRSNASVSEHFASCRSCFLE